MISLYPNIKGYIMKIIASGAQANIYKEGSKIIKIFKKNIQKEEVEYEVNLQKMAFSYGLPVPKIYGIIEINDKLGIEMDFIDGITLGKAILADKSKTYVYLEKSIELQNEIHRIETDKFPLMKNRLKMQILHARKLSDMEKNKILIKLEQAKFDNKLCHGDFHVLNLIQTQQDIKIIDWICACSGHPYADVYRTYLLYKLVEEEFAKMYIEIYCKKYSIDKMEILDWELIIAGARIGEYIKSEIEENILKGIIRNCI